MIEKLILHVGPHKTGTTAIQQMLHALQRESQLSEYCYPNIGISEFGHHELAHTLQNKSFDKFRALTADIASIEGPVILSSENFSRLTRGQIQSLRDAIPSLGCRVVFYIRNFLHVPYSWWQEIVKHGDVRSFGRFMVDSLARPYQFHLFNVTSVVQNYAEVFGESSIELYLYDPIVQSQNNIIDHFAEQVLALTPMESGDRGARLQQQQVNKSFSPVEAEVIRVLNRRHGRGIKIFLENAALRDCCRSVMASSETAAYYSTIPLSYNDFFFADLERKLMKAHGAKIKNQTPGTEARLFVDRSSVTTYAGSDFWLGGAKYVAEINRLRGIVEGLA